MNLIIASVRSPNIDRKWVTVVQASADFLSPEVANVPHSNFIGGSDTKTVYEYNGVVAIMIC